MAKSLNLNNKDIQNLQSEFSENGKWVEQVRYNFPHCKGMLCQGLFLLHKRKTGAKKIILDYWLNTNDETVTPAGRTVKGVSKRFVMGNYDKTSFNVKHIEEKIADLRKLYGNPHNLTWDQDIYEGEQLKRRTRFTDQLVALQDYTVNHVIESFFVNGCPKINKPSESLNKNTMVDNTRYMVGYHDRLKCMRFTADKTNNGIIKLTDASGVEDIKDLFIKYPSEQLNKYGEGISIYDGLLGQKNIRELTEFDLRNYLNTVTTSPGTRRQIKECFSYIWNHALNKSMLGPTPPLNPMTNIKIERPTTTAYSKYDTAEFTKAQQSRIHGACMKLRDVFVFQTQVILLMLFTGRRRETLLKLTWNDIQFFKETHVMEDGTKVTTYGRIEIPKHVNKTKKSDKILLTDNVYKVILDLQQQRLTMGWSKYSDWLFPSTRIPNKHLLSATNKANEEESRLKDVRALFNTIKKTAELTGPAAMKMFRNTYENTVNRNRNAASTWDVISVTGRTDTSSSEKSYLNKSFTPTVVELSASVDKEFDNIINIRKSG